MKFQLIINAPRKKEKKESSRWIYLFVLGLGENEWERESNRYLELYYSRWGTNCARISATLIRWQRSLAGQARRTGAAFSALIVLDIFALCLRAPTLPRSARLDMLQANKQKIVYRDRGRLSRAEPSRADRTGQRLVRSFQISEINLDSKFNKSCPPRWWLMNCALCLWFVAPSDRSIICRGALTSVRRGRR